MWEQAQAASASAQRSSEGQLLLTAKAVLQAVTTHDRNSDIKERQDPQHEVFDRSSEVLLVTLNR